MCVQIAVEGVLPTAKGEERHGRRYSDIDSDHSDFDPAGVFARGFSVAGENARRVAEVGAVHQFDRFLEIVYANDREHRAEDFFTGDGGIRPDVIEDGRTYIVSLIIRREPLAAVAHQFGA